MPPFPHRFQVPVTLVPTFSLSFLLVLSLVSLEQQCLYEPACNVEILHHAQMGQDVYIYGIRTYQTYIYTYIYIDNFPFSPQVWGSLRSPQLLLYSLVWGSLRLAPIIHRAGMLWTPNLSGNLYSYPRDLFYNLPSPATPPSQQLQNRLSTYMILQVQNKSLLSMTLWYFRARLMMHTSVN